MPAGILLCLASAASFGGMGIFGTLAYSDGATVGTLLATRFTVAAALFWVLVGVIAARRPRPADAGRRSPMIARRDAVAAVTLGVVYAASAGCYFTALRRIDPGLLSLLLYTSPAMVAVAAIALGRERGSLRTATALALGTGGLALVVAGAGAGALDPRGVVLGLATAVIYSAYVLTTAGLSTRVHPLLLSALVCSGAAVTLIVAAAVVGDLHPGAVTIAGAGWLGAIAVVSTVAAVSLFFAGMSRVGATTASILSTAEPLTAVALAALVFGEALGPVQMAGAALIVGAVVVLARRAPAGAPAAAARPAPALRPASSRGGV